MRSSYAKYVKIGMSDSLLNIYFAPQPITHAFGSHPTVWIPLVQKMKYWHWLFDKVSCCHLNVSHIISINAKVKVCSSWTSKSTSAHMQAPLLYILAPIHSYVLQISIAKTLALHTLCHLSPGRPCLLSCYTSYKWNFNPMPPEGYLRKDSKANNYETSSPGEPISVHGCLATALTGRRVESCLSHHTFLA